MMSMTSNTALTHVQKVSMGLNTRSHLAFAPSLKMRSARPVQRTASLGVRAEAGEEQSVETQANKPMIVQAANNMGYNTDEGLFGFTPFSELWTGRLAMSGFTIGLVTEVTTGEGILQQIGLSDGYENPALFTALVLLMGGASLAATTKTILDITTGNMSAAQKENYAKGFGLTDEQTARLNSTAAQMKEEEEPSTSMDEALSEPLNQTVVERTTGGSAVPGYAEHVETNNGRWAMIGFATAILIEAATGRGIIPQLISYGKASGLLGVDSGF
eukprot:CAMPEP_0197853952 /NCGR_PEP_ID=MMETSP1438-20131217/23764_1 /TAXON_ID=1461541 /ORGANISM="Pterosperma sp., Strain CCMP1384" /LENGTH=272 /DNA_ID=CAMNT_0043468541 /DNA_START=72 /DNA_END=890 /DNA_ORIENTATION=+